MLKDQWASLGAEIKQLYAGGAGLFATALLARFLFHWRLVQSGHRRFWSLQLVWEFPTALFIAIVAGGLASYLELAPSQGYALAGVCGWLGPRGLEVLLARLVERYGDKGPRP